MELSIISKSSSLGLKLIEGIDEIQDGGSKTHKKKRDMKELEKE